MLWHPAFLFAAVLTVFLIFLYVTGSFERLVIQSKNGDGAMPDFFIGFTTVEVANDTTIETMHGHCRGLFGPDSRMATQIDKSLFGRVPVPIEGAWITPASGGVIGFGGLFDSKTCYSWGYLEGTETSAIQEFKRVAGSFICATRRRVACVVPMTPSGPKAADIAAGRDSDSE